MKITLHGNKLYALIVAYMLSFLAFLNLGNEILNLLGFHTYLDTAALYGLLVALVILGFVFSVFESTIKIDILCCIFFFLISYLLSFLLFPANEEYIFTSWADYDGNPLYILFVYSLPGYIFARKMEDYQYFKRIMCVFSYSVVLMSFVVFFFSKESSAAQYMTFSYNMLTQLLFLIMHKPQKNKVIHYIIVSVGLFVFVFGGARGATLSLAIAVIILTLTTRKATITNVILTFLVLVAVILIAFFKSAILLWLSAVLDAFSIESRNFQHLLEGELLEDSHRFELYEQIINNTGFLGKGVMGDRIILHTYSHNLFLEILVQFGWVVGGLIVGALCYCIGRALLNKSAPEYLWLILLLPCGFLKLMLTGSYLNQEPAFYIFLGFCINAILRSRKQCEYS